MQHDFGAGFVRSKGDGRHATVVIAFEAYDNTPLAANATPLAGTGIQRRFDAVVRHRDRSLCQPIAGGRDLKRATSPRCALLTASSVIGCAPSVCSVAKAPQWSSS
jgi:hypothetical protein